MGRDMSETLRASVVVPCFDAWTDLQTCLEFLAKQSVPQDQWEVILAINHETMPLPPSLQLPGNALVVFEPTPGSYAARNAGLRVARAEVIFFTDSDCEPHSAWLESGLRVFDARPQTMRCSGPITLTSHGKTWTSAAAYDALFNLRQETGARIGLAATANLAVRRKVLDKIGAFKENAFSGEDYGWNARAQEAGYSLEFVPNMRVQHPARSRLGDLMTKSRRKTGARYIKRRQTSRLRASIPPLELVLPSLVALRTALKARHFDLRTRLGAWLIHYFLRLGTIVETVRLSLGGAPERR